MGRKPAEPDYGLPPLTFEEASRVLGVNVGAFMNWVMYMAKPSSGRWGEWISGKRQLPERLIRLYLVSRVQVESVHQQQLKELGERRALVEGREEKATRTRKKKRNSGPEETQATG